MTISYLTAFVFHGTKERLGVGHISLADDQYYYSYDENSPIAKKIVPEIPEIYQSNSLRNLVAYDMAIYGNFHSVILPANAQLEFTLKKCQEEIAKLENKHYSFFNQNCAHAIQSFFENAGYLKKIIDYIVPLTPHELGNRLAEVGQAIMEHTLKKIVKINPIPNYKEARDFVLKAELNPKCPKDIKDVLEKSTDINKDYFFLLKICSERHYQRVEPHDFYSTQFMQALNICPVKPDDTFTFTEYRILRSIPRTAGSALLVAAVIPVGAAAFTLAMAASIAAAAITFALGILALPYIVYKYAQSKAVEENTIDHSHVPTKFQPKISTKGNFSLPGAQYFRFT